MIDKNNLVDLINEFFEFIISSNEFCIVNKKGEILLLSIPESIVDVDSLYSFLRTELKYKEVDEEETRGLLNLIVEAIDTIPNISPESSSFEIEYTYRDKGSKVECKSTKFISSNPEFLILDVCKIYKTGIKLIGYTGETL